MGGGRKTRTFTGSERIPSSPTTVNSSVSTRGLRKSDLGGVIFGCKHKTMTECLSKQLFGLPAGHFSYVKNIVPGLPLFLFNYSDRKLHGIFESASGGQMYIDPYCWSEDGVERTPYPAQVRIFVRTQCQPLLEKQFQPIIRDNFYTNIHFWFELDHYQVDLLKSLFLSTSKGVMRASLPNQLPGMWQLGNSSGTSGPSTEMKTSISSKNEAKLSVEWTQTNQYEVLGWDDVNNNECNSSCTSSSSGHEDISLSIFKSDSHDLNVANMNIGCSSSNPCFNGEGQAIKVHTEEVKENDTDMVLSKLQQLASNHESLNPFESVHSVPCVIESDHRETIKVHNEEVKENDKDMVSSKLQQLASNHECLNPFESVHSVPCVIESDHQDDVQLGSPISSVKDGSLSATSVDLHHELTQLRQEIQELKSFRMEQLRRNVTLEEKLIEYDQELQQLRSRVVELEDQSTSCIGELSIELPQMCQSDLGGSIYLIGGFDGTTWLAGLDSYSPSNDRITPLMPMSFARSYACATALDGDIYVIGGGINGNMWFDTVERYCPKTNVWTPCPSLMKRKGSLAGVTVKSKLYAIGGGNGYESFSDVEMFDPALGRWINNASMFQQRFAPAAAELNGVIYVVGGYDGKEYLKSAESFDPREASWTRLPSMSTKRGCHSLALLNEKLYAMGGFDGESMVNSVDVYDPRAGSWMSGDPMIKNRGYAATAVLGDTLYVLGGVEVETTLLNTVECYKEDLKWWMTNLKAVGKRCFFNAIVI